MDAAASEADHDSVVAEADCLNIELRIHDSLLGVKILAQVVHFELIKGLQIGPGLDEKSPENHDALQSASGNEPDLGIAIKRINGTFVRKNPSNYARLLPDVNVTVVAGRQQCVVDEADAEEGHINVLSIVVFYLLRVELFLSFCFGIE